MDLIHLLDIFWEAWLTFYNNNMYFMYSMQLHLYKQPPDLRRYCSIAVSAGCWLCGVCALNIMFLSAGGYFTFSQSKYYCDLNFVATNRPESSPRLEHPSWWWRHGVLLHQVSSGAFLSSILHTKQGDNCIQPQSSTVQHSTVQHSTVQYSTVCHYFRG